MSEKGKEPGMITGQEVWMEAVVLKANLARNGVNKKVIYENFFVLLFDFQ